MGNDKKKPEETKEEKTPSEAVETEGAEESSEGASEGGEEEKKDSEEGENKEEEEKKPSLLSKLAAKLPHSNIKLPRFPKAEIKKFFSFFTAFPISISNALIYGDMRTKVITVGLLISISILVGGARDLWKTIDVYIQKHYGDGQAEVQLQEIRESLKNQEFDFKSFMEKRFGGDDDHRRIDLGPMSIVAQSEKNALVNSVEVQIYLVCDNPESAAFFKKYRAHAQDAIITAIEPVNFDVSRTPAGKEEIRKVIATALNRLGRENAVQEVYFSEFLAN